MNRITLLIFDVKRLEFDFCLNSNFTYLGCLHVVVWWVDKKGIHMCQNLHAETISKCDLSSHLFCFFYFHWGKKTSWNWFSGNYLFLLVNCSMADSGDIFLHVLFADIAMWRLPKKLYSWLIHICHVYTLNFQHRPLVYGLNYK